MQEQNKALNSQNSSIQLKEDEEEKTLQAKAAPTQRMVEEEEEIQAKQAGEKPGTDMHSIPVSSKMNEAIQAKMENSFGTSFSGMNIIHNDSSSTHMGALAYTKGKDVHFAPGQYNLGSQKGQELLGHELTYVVQQQGRVSKTTQQKGISVNDDPSLEQEADNMGKKAANGQSVDVVGEGNGVQKQDEDVENNTEETLSTTLGLSGSVGKDCTNSDTDVLIVKNKLIEYGFLESSETTQNQINDAIGEFQKEVLNYSKPDKQISANGATDRALTTYYSPIKKEGDYDAIENQIETDFTHAIVRADSDFAAGFDSNDKIKENTCRKVVHDKESNTTYRGIDAEEFMSKNAIYAAMMIRAGANSDIKNMQLKVAKEKYVDISEAKKLDFVVKAIKVAEGGVNGTKDIIGADNVAEYKKTDEYETNNTNGNITEIDLDLKNMTLGEILASEKELAALYGTYINTPGTSISSFRDAIEAIIIDKGLTTEQEVKNIDPVELLTKAKELNTSSIHKGRIQDAIDEEGLSSS